MRRSQRLILCNLEAEAGILTDDLVAQRVDECSLLLRVLLQIEDIGQERYRQ